MSISSAVKLCWFFREFVKKFITGKSEKFGLADVQMLPKLIQELLNSDKKLLKGSYHFISYTFSISKNKFKNSACLYVAENSWILLKLNTGDLVPYVCSYHIIK